MPKKNEVRRIVEIGYGFPAQRGGVMFFRVGALASNSEDWDALLATIAQIEYGDFDGEDLAEMLRTHKQEISLVEFGREYSPVVYLHFNISNSPDLARGNKTAIKNFVETLDEMHGIEPDEADWMPTRNSLRLWWD